MQSSKRWRILSRWLGILLLFGLVSCAYFNTFFVAKKSFNEAEELVRLNTKETLPTEARRNYGTAIKQCKKVLDRHGNSKWADDATYLMAASYYGIGDYDSALMSLADLEAIRCETAHDSAAQRAGTQNLRSVRAAVRRDCHAVGKRAPGVHPDLPAFGHADPSPRTLRDPTA